MLGLATTTRVCAAFVTFGDAVVTRGPRLRRGGRFFAKSCEERCSSRSSEYLKQKKGRGFGAGIIVLPLALAACGSDVPTSSSAVAAQGDAASRDAVQAGRIDNPDALACVRANASDGEWAVIAGQDGHAEVTLQTVLDREGTIRCFHENNVVVYL